MQRCPMSPAPRASCKTRREEQEGKGPRARATALGNKTRVPSQKQESEKKREGWEEVVTRLEEQRMNEWLRDGGPSSPDA